MSRSQRSPGWPTFRLRIGGRLLLAAFLLIGLTSAGGTLIDSDEAFANALLDETGVAVVFGAAFGLSPHFRISYATSDAVLQDAMARIRRFCEGCN